MINSGDDDQLYRKGKKYNQKGQNVPINELGFRPKLDRDVVDPRKIKTRFGQFKKYVYKINTGKNIPLNQVNNYFCLA